MTTKHPTETPEYWESLARSERAFAKRRHASCARRSSEMVKRTVIRISDTVEIRRRVVGHRYPRNGNVGMTNTEIVNWEVWRNGRLAIPSLPTLREAKRYAANPMEE